MTRAVLQPGACIIARDALHPGQCHEFECPQGAAFLLRTDDGWRAFRNHCPHVGLQLNWKPNEFFDSSGQHLICSGHGALFRPADGHCFSGPCTGQQLEPVAIEVREDGIYLG